MPVINEEFNRRKNQETNIFADLRRKLYTLFGDFQKNEITKNFRTTMKVDPVKAIKELQNSLGEEISINFNCGDSMDYANPWICQQYMLRYTMAYAFEYYVMYLIALSQLDDPAARAYSFGCGSGLDCLSLAYAKVKLDYDKEVSYRGIDLIDWAENFELKNLPIVDAKKYVDKKGMLAFLKKDPEYMPNILFFPKILSELNDEIITLFCNLLKDLKSEELIVCVSYRSSETMSNDFEKVCPIITSLEEKYECKKLKVLDEIYDIFNIHDINEKQLSLIDENNGIFEFTGENKGTKYSKIDDNFTVPKDIWAYIGVPGIRGICAKAKSLADCDVCDLKEQCPHSAIANVDHMCFQIIHLKKKS